MSKLAADVSTPVVRLEIHPGGSDSDNRSEAQRWGWSMAGWVSEQLARAHAAAMIEARDVQQAFDDLPSDEVFVVLQPDGEQEPN